MNLGDLFPDEDFRFKMQFREGSLQSFYSTTPSQEAFLSEKHQLLQNRRAEVAAFLGESAPLLNETIRLLHPFIGLPAEALRAILEAPSVNDMGCLFSRYCEPDFLLLNTSLDPQLLGGCVCFPSSWNLAEKIGRPLSLIHEVVPGLNDRIGRNISTFLHRLRPGVSWERTNWGLSRVPDLNQHPSRNLPRLDSSIQLEEAWLRVEHQSLAALPQSNGILFGIRILMIPLAQAISCSTVQRGLRRAILTMPEAVAHYKNLAAARERLLQFI